MTSLPPRSAASIAGLLALAGCTDRSSGYPSLAPRPIEQLSLAEPAARPVAPQVADPAAVARYATTIAQARDADAEFRRALERERGTLGRGRGATIGSDAWAAAQVSLSRLETAREPVIKLLADLDAARNAEPAHANGGEALAAAQAFEQVQQIDTAEATALSTARPR